MKVLVTGYNGQLGFDVIRALEKRQTECRGTTREDFDLTDAQAVRECALAFLWGEGDDQPAVAASHRVRHRQ